MNKSEVWADIPRLNGHYQVGNLTKNPESGSTSSGISYSRFTIAAIADIPIPTAIGNLNYDDL